MAKSSNREICYFPHPFSSKQHRNLFTSEFLPFASQIIHNLKRLKTPVPGYSSIDTFIVGSSIFTSIQFLFQFLRILGTIFIINYTFPKIIIAILPLGLLIVWILKVFFTVSRIFTY